MIRQGFSFAITLAFVAGHSGCAAEPPHDEADSAADDDGNARLGTAVSADFATTSMSISVTTGGDDLRGSSIAYLSVLRGDGTWSSEFPIIGTAASAWSTTPAVITASWDGYDPCARAIQLRPQQGSFRSVSDR